MSEVERIEEKKKKLNMKEKKLIKKYVLKVKLENEMNEQKIDFKKTMSILGIKIRNGDKQLCIYNSIKYKKEDKNVK